MDDAEYAGETPSRQECRGGGAALPRASASGGARINDARRPPFLAMPYPLDEYIDEMPGDYGKVVRRMLRSARWSPGEVDGIHMDAGEALIDERSEKLWGPLRLDRGHVSVDARRALVRRVLERLEADGYIARRPARRFGPQSGPCCGPRRGPSPTVVRFLKYREILWPARGDAAQETAQAPAHGSAQRRGPIPPGCPPDPPRAPAAAAASREHERHYPALVQLADALSERWKVNVVLPRNGRAELEAAVKELGLEAAVEECHGDALAAFDNRRIESPPTSLGFSAQRLLLAARRQRQRAAGHSMSAGSIVERSQPPCTATAPIGSGEVVEPDATLISGVSW